MKLIAAPGHVNTLRDINIRMGAPSLSAKTKTVTKNTILAVVGYINNGAEVNGNTKWFQTTDANYVWSGNVALISEAPVCILHAPLDVLICTQKFGERPAVYKKLGSPKGHNGLDFRTRSANKPSDWKKPVYAALEGVVSEAAYDAAFKGNYVRIIHPNNFETVYLHLFSIRVAVGDSVVARTQIGISGNSGAASEAPHLHFGYRPVDYKKNNGYMGYVDPAPYFIDEIHYV